MNQPDKHNHYLYNNRLQPNANKLRKTMTKSEACLWKYLLKESQMKGYVFRRQRPILDYIADFMCKELLLVIELDGVSHFDADVIRKAERKQRDLENAGYTVLRFWDSDVLERIGWAQSSILDWIEVQEREKGIRPFKDGALPPG
ncbi:MAG: endonuclease domain-containing protein [Chitinophagaceae bacterium]